jgi:hypothetical protein
MKAIRKVNQRLSVFAEKPRMVALTTFSRLL